MEAALVTPVFFLILFGIIEIGFLFRDYLTVSNAASQGARAASVAGNNDDADFVVLRTVEHGIAAMGLDDVQKVIVYKASGPGDSVPAACLAATTGIANVCNIYDQASFTRALNNLNPDGTVQSPTGFFGCDAAGTGTETAIDTSWCPTDRVAALSGFDKVPGNADDGTDYVGIYVSANHNYITGFFQAQTTLSTDRIIRIEPSRN